jgi:hypothetical protein
MGAGDGGQLNPTWVSWLMGFPLNWLHSSDLETVSEICLYLGLPEEFLIAFKNSGRSGMP